MRLTRKLATLAVMEAFGRSALFAEPAPATAGAPATPPPPPAANPATTAETPATPRTPIKGSKAAKKAAKAKPAPKKKAAGASGKNKGLSGPAVLKAYAPKYKKGGKDGKTKTAGGNLTIDNGDKLADRLRSKTLPEVYEEAVKVLNTALEDGEKPLTVQALKLKYGKLNLGMQRMNLGNRMRAALGLSKSGK